MKNLWKYGVLLSVALFIIVIILLMGSVMIHGDNPPSDGVVKFIGFSVMVLITSVLFGVITNWKPVCKSIKSFIDET